MGQRQSNPPSARNAVPNSIWDIIVVFIGKNNLWIASKFPPPDSRNGWAAWWQTSKLFSFLAKFATSSPRIAPDWRPCLLKRRNTSCLKTEQMRLHSVGKCRHENFRGITKPKLKSCNQLRNAAAANWKNVAMNHFVQRLIMDGGGFRQNGVMNIYRSYLRRQDSRRILCMWYTTTRAIPVKWQTVKRTERGQTIV